MVWAVEMVGHSFVAWPLQSLWMMQKGFSPPSSSLVHGGGFYIRTTFHALAGAFRRPLPLSVLPMLLPAFISTSIPASIPPTGGLYGVDLPGGASRDFLLPASFFTFQAMLPFSVPRFPVFVVRSGLTGVPPLFFAKLVVLHPDALLHLLHQLQHVLWRVSRKL